MIGSGIVALAYAIDPDWPIHLRRLLLILWTISGRSGGYYDQQFQRSLGSERDIREPIWSLSCSMVLRWQIWRQLAGLLRGSSWPRSAEVWQHLYRVASEQISAGRQRLANGNE